MHTINIRSFLIGFLLATCLLLLVGAGNHPAQGRFQIAVEGKRVFIVDTASGVIKRAFIAGNGGLNQLGTPFRDMKLH